MIKLRIEEATYTVDSQTRTYVVPEVSEENYDVIEDFVSQWGDDIEDYEWISTNDGFGEFRLTTDKQIAELIVVWILRHGLTETKKPISYFIPECVTRRRKKKPF